MIPLASLCHAAETNAPAAHSSRYLVAVDMSASVKKRASNVETAVAQLIASGMNGKMHRGDTLGLWTFNERLYAGAFPVQTWTSERRVQIAAAAVSFLREQKYERKAQPAVVLIPLQRIVKDSDRITALIVTDGSTPMSGTPYDADINTYFKNNFDVQKNARMPFVVVLRAKSGEYLGHTVNASPWPVEFPAFPPEPEIVEAPKPKAEEAPKPAPRLVVPSLIVIGTKRETNVPPPVVVPQPQVSATKPATATTTAILPSAPELAVVAPPKASPPEPPPVPPAPAMTTSVSIPQTAAPTTAAMEEKGAQAPLPNPAPTIVPPEKTSETAAPAAKVSESTSPPTTVPVQAAVATPDVPSTPRIWPLVAGAALLGLALGVILMLMKRSRPAAHASLITRSLDRDKQ